MPPKKLATKDAVNKKRKDAENVIRNGICVVKSVRLYGHLTHV